MRYDTEFALLPYNAGCIRCGSRYSDPSHPQGEVTFEVCRRCQAKLKSKPKPRRNYIEATVFDFKRYVGGKQSR
jgi:hypothetical protein